MSNLKELPHIMETRKPKETCSQFVFGPKKVYVDEAIEIMAQSPDFRRLNQDETPQQDDIIFYTDIFGYPSHVGRIIEDGLVQSKFSGDPNVYIHEMRGEPVPKSLFYQTSIIFRKNN